jgi:hypothetical protein
MLEIASKRRERSPITQLTPCGKSVGVARRLSLIICSTILMLLSWLRRTLVTVLLKFCEHISRPEFLMIYSGLLLRRNLVPHCSTFKFEKMLQCSVHECKGHVKFSENIAMVMVTTMVIGFRKGVATVTSGATFGIHGTFVSLFSSRVEQHVPSPGCCNSDFWSHSHSLRILRGHAGPLQAQLRASCSTENCPTSNGSCNIQPGGKPT